MSASGAHRRRESYEDRLFRLMREWTREVRQHAASRRARSLQRAIERHVARGPDESGRSRAIMPVPLALGGLALHDQRSGALALAVALAVGIAALLVVQAIRHGIARRRKPDRQLYDHERQWGGKW